MKNTQLWFRGVRTSKFRHVYGEPAKREKCYDNITITKNAHDSQFCAVNPKFLAVVTEVAGGGAFVVLPIDNTGRLDFNSFRVTGHRGPVLDIKWDPFNDNIIASCSDDGTVKLWHIPDGGLGTHLTDWLLELVGHKRRVAYIEWHPTAENILFSVGFDHLIIVWDIEKGEAINVLDLHSDVIYSMSINRDGSLLATTCKDKKLRIIEPRSGIVKLEGVCHAGSKASKVAFLNGGKLITTGFSRHSDRQYSIWDENDLSQPLVTDTIDSSSGVVFPFYDPDTNIVFLAGKGDGNIRYYEIVDEHPYVHFLSQFLSGNPQRGLGVMPKRGLNTSVCEIYKFYKLHTSRNICEPISMIVPRKSDHFHEDLYPDTAAAKPALTAQEWINGRNSMPILMSLRSGANIDLPTKPVALTLKTTPLLSQENNKKKFAFLSTTTTPDYRSKDEILSYLEKSQKTTNNQHTRIQQLQQKINNCTIARDDDLILKQLTNYNNINIDELRKAFLRQSEELRMVRMQLLNSESKVKELEDHVRRLERQISL
ncbi:coronin-2B-like isoform X2 [Photinus pyralis]|uniref:Coronin n=1 Tax=Photinus pyralis TaxID=7054 RepID=A0A1Y1LHM6_PHOPY|nr:coronin-2B-like isoform X2 [Photinus pyralis]XP_031334710.1 coronin-2B-like isoform X2 [Photinus pyralis]XP_031334711.1 coronin-2B-like isoform X2 [Photinus pyralis]XP_031334712.1 coronin-2B-like isoform X2 [Photinus pyralis]